MNEQMKLSKKEQMAQYIASARPYVKKEPLAFDLRGYAIYVKEKNLDAKDISSETMAQFQVKD
ncbi:MAG: hypothetical protein IJ109_05235 [Firmicutes bacterium]|nr:hypothetical protein [Bacillota bacterium]